MTTSVMVDGWCRRWLGAAPRQVLFERRQLSYVVGMLLDDGRAVVVKAREPAARLGACALVQRHLWAAGYPCPELLAGPAPLGDLAATAEAYLPEGELLPRGQRAPHLFAEALARLVALAPAPAALPSLAPAPPWVGWDHGERGIWPRPDNLAVDLNTAPGPTWLDEAGRLARELLGASALPAVVGHADWEAQNLRWRGDTLVAAHDWDSVVALPEAMIAGAAAAVFPADRAPLSEATVAESAAFLAAYAAARGRAWSDHERRAAWAAGLWVRAFNARKACARDPASPVLARLEEEVNARRAEAGLDT